MTYLVLSAVFLLLAVALLIVGVLTHPAPGALLRRWMLPVLISGAVLVILTAVFDNVMISVGLVAYSSEATSGLRVGVAPIEDFAYPVAGILLLPALWLLLRRRGHRHGR